VLTGLPYEPSEEGFRIRSAGSGLTSVGELSIGDGNPLFEDDNVDGIPDRLAEKLGVQHRHDLVPGTGRALLDHYMGAVGKGD